MEVWLNGGDTVGYSFQRKLIKKNFKITTSLRKNKGKWIIYFPKKEIKKLYQAIEKYLLLSLKYKFPIAP